MHIAYVHQYFATPHGHTGTRSYEFARRWVAAGHRVTMLTSTAQLTPTDVPGGDLNRQCEFEVAGIHVIAMPIRYSQKMGKLARLLAFVRFMLAGTIALLRLRDLDVVYATSTPLTVAVPALARKWLRGTPFVFEVRDLWPEIPFQLGYLRNRPLLWFLRRFERLTYRSAMLVVALSPGMRDGVLAAAGPAKPVVVAPNCSDTGAFRPEVDRAAVRARHGWQNRFVCMHVGAIGMSNGLDAVIRAAERLRDDPTLLFVLVGDGRERPLLEQMAAERGLTNVLFLGQASKTEVPGLFAAADLSLVTFAPYPILEHNSANKFFDSLSAGKPIVLNYGGWQREMLETADAGVGCRQGDEDAFADHIRALKAAPDRRMVMSLNARRLAEERFSRDKLASEVLAAVERALLRR